MRFEDPTARYLFNCALRVNMLGLQYGHPRGGKLSIEGGGTFGGSMSFFPVGKTFPYLANPGNVMRSMLMVSAYGKDIDAGNIGFHSVILALYGFIDDYKRVMQ